MLETKNTLDKELLYQTELVGKLVGSTPVRVFHHWKKNLKVFAKLEWKQLSGSVKARAAYFIIHEAIREGKLSDNKRLLDATSGNTGIAYATICKKLGIGITLCLPENASWERKSILEDLGVEIMYTSQMEGTDGGQLVALEIANSNPEKYFYADQYKNANNWKAHYFTTAPEILLDVPGVTHFVAGLGTTGTFIGTGRRLKEARSAIELVGLQPDSALHGLEGWKHLETAVVPAIYDATVADVQEEVSTEEAYNVIAEVYRQEGLLLSPSSAANLAGAFRIAERNKNNVVVTILPDNADKYSEVIKRLNL